MSLSHCPQCDNPLDPAIARDEQTCKSCGWSSHAESTSRDRHGNTNDNDFAAALLSPENRVVLSALSHGCTFLSALVIVPIVIPFVLLFACESSIVKSNAREALNYQLNSLILLVVISVVALISAFIAPVPFALSLVLFPVYGIANFIVSLWAIIQVFNHPNETIFYPFIYRFIKA